MAEKENPPIIIFRQAKKLGLKRYYTGKLCKREHLSERMVSNRRCVKCLREDQKIWREKNPEHAYATKRAWDDRNKDHIKKYELENKETIKETKKLWRKNNPEKVKMWRKKWLGNNKDHVRQWAREYGIENREILTLKSREYNRRRPEVKRTSEANRRARKAGSKGQYTSEDVNDLLKKQKYRCVSCLVSVKNGYHVDHVTPLHLNGSNGKDNIQILCPTCNVRKHAKDPFVWAQQNGRLL